MLKLTLEIEHEGDDGNISVCYHEKDEADNVAFIAALSFIILAASDFILGEFDLNKLHKHLKESIAEKVSDWVIQEDTP